MERIELPEEWEWRALGDEQHFSLLMGQSPPSESYNSEGEGLPFFQGKAEFGTTHPKPKKWCSTPLRIAALDDVLMSVRAPVGPTNLADQSCCIGRGLAAIRCKTSISPRFLLYALRYIEEEIAASVAGHGGGFTAIKRERLEEVEIPVPPLHEQERIVARIDAQTHRVEAIRKAQRELVTELRGILAGYYTEICADAEWKPLDEVAPHVRRPVSVEAGKSYPELGIRSFGKGTFHKPAIAAEHLGSKRIYHIHPGDLIFNNVFGWEGAVAVVKPEDAGRVGSHRFITCVPKANEVTTPFLYFHFTTEQGLHDLGDASPGGAGRNRTLGLTALGNIRVPVPDYDKQVVFTRLWEKVETTRRLQTELAADLAAFVPALLAKAFRGEL
ncbi:MAG: restriction endonuclease subunit S [Sulfuricella sp.]